MSLFTNRFWKKGRASIKSRQVVLKVAFPFNKEWSCQKVNAIWTPHTQIPLWISISFHFLINKILATGNHCIQIVSVMWPASFDLVFLGSLFHWCYLVRRTHNISCSATWSLTHPHTSRSLWKMAMWLSELDFLCNESSLLSEKIRSHMDGIHTGQGLTFCGSWLCYIWWKINLVRAVIYLTNSLVTGRQLR